MFGFRIQKGKAKRLGWRQRQPEMDAMSYFAMLGFTVWPDTWQLKKFQMQQDYDLRGDFRPQF